MGVRYKLNCLKINALTRWKTPRNNLSHLWFFARRRTGTSSVDFVIQSSSDQAFCCARVAFGFVRNSTLQKRTSISFPPHCSDRYSDQVSTPAQGEPAPGSADFGRFFVNDADLWKNASSGKSVGSAIYGD